MLSQFQDRFLALKEKQMLQTLDNSSEPVVIDESQLYLKAAAGMNKQRLYGVGSQACSFYPDEAGSSSMSSRMRQAALQEEVNRLQQESELLQEKVRQQHEEMRQQLQEVVRQQLQEERQRMEEEMRQ